MRNTLIDRFPNLIEVASPSPLPGVFYQDAELGGAITCTASEALILDALMLSVDPRHAVEIGSYIGWSSAHLAWHIDGELTCIDNYSEGPGNLQGSHPDAPTRFWENINRTPGKDAVRLYEYASPDILPVAVPPEKWGLAFIDGWHLDGQPLKDVQGVIPHLLEDAPIVLHDLWMPDVRAAGDYLNAQGWHSYLLPTPGCLGVFWRGTARWVPSFIARIGGII